MELNKENLYNEYIVKNKTQEECAKIFNVSKWQIIRKAKEYNYMKNGINSNKKDTNMLKKQILENMGSDYELLTPYVNSYTEITLLHKKCGNKFSFKPSHINPHGIYRDCPFCRKQKKDKISDEEFSYLYERKGFTITEAEEYGITKKMFYGRVRRLGLQRNDASERIAKEKRGSQIANSKIKYRITNEIEREIICGLKEGKSFTTLEEECNIPTYIMISYAKENNLMQYRDEIKFKEKKKELLKNNLLEKYGVKNVMDVQEFREKAILNKPDIHVSKPEIELREYVQSIYSGEVIRTNDGTYELDIYIPDKKVGIEYNGNYWHSLKNREKNYHYNKSKHFEEKGIRVIHIWEYEWDNPRQRPILENIIKNALGLNDKTIYARKCKIEVRPSASMKDFFQKNNIQGFRGGKFAICLVYENEVVMAYMMGHCFFGKGKYEWEVIRGATKLGYNVVGGASKIWNYFLTEYNPTNCVYYIDYNYFNGNSLPYLGLTYIKSQAGFKNWWVKTNEVKNREPLRHKEIMRLQALGEVIPIYNAGTKVYVWENNNIKSGNKKNEG